MFDSELVLIGRSVSSYDLIGQPIYQDNTRTTVLGTVVPVSRSEFYQAAQNGIDVEYEFVINPVEYSGQKILEYTDQNGRTKKYDIIRSYEKNPDELEIYCKLRPGTNPVSVASIVGGGL